MERVEDREENLESLSESIDGEGEDTKEPGESKEEHHSTDTDHQTYDGFVADWFLHSSCRVSCVTNQYHNHANEDDNVEYHDNNDWNQKGSPEGPRMRQEAAAYKSKINS